jgi:membrane-associated phospholipid phosphatase
MLRKGTLAARLVPGCVLFGALLLAAPIWADGALPAPLSPTAASEPAGRLFLSATLHSIADFGTSPLRATWEDLAWAVPAGVALGVVLNNDVPIYDNMAKGAARQDWLDHSMPAVSALGDGTMEFAAAALMDQVGDARLRRTSAMAMQALLVVGVWAEAFKLAAWSNRPYIDDSAHKFFDYGQDSQGFPSGHSYSAFAAAEVYGAEYGRWWTYPLAALVAYSRVYNQDHWPSDILAGSLLGVITGVQVRRAAEAQGPPLIQFSLEARGAQPVMVARARF